MARRRKKASQQPPPPPLPPPPPSPPEPPEFETQQQLHEYMLHHPNEPSQGGRYWFTHAAYTKYGHWLDPSKPYRRDALWLMRLQLGMMECCGAPIDMLENNEVCCKGHEYLPLAQRIKKKKRQEREREKNEADAKEPGSGGMDMGKAKHNDNA